MEASRTLSSSMEEQNLLQMDFNFQITKMSIDEKSKRKRRKFSFLSAAFFFVLLFVCLFVIIFWDYIKSGFSRHSLSSFSISIICGFVVKLVKVSFFFSSGNYPTSFA